MRHENIRKKAEFIDRFIELYRGIHKTTNFPHGATEKLILLLFPKSEHLGKGAFKTAILIRSNGKKFVLKISERRNLGKDFTAYRRIPETLRNRYVAKTYWATKHCLLQKWAKQTKISKKDPQLLELKKKLKSYGLTDIRPANVGFIDGHLKAIDISLKK